MNQTIYWTLVEHNPWKMYLAATEKGLCYVGSSNQSFAELSDWVKKHFPQSILVQNDEECKPYVTEFVEYLQGKREIFTFPVDFKGTPFQLAVWNALKQVPYGETYTYTQIAELIQKPNAVRAVGAAIGANPVLVTVPCHRVIGKNRTLTGYRGGLEMKKQLLLLEGVK